MNDVYIALAEHLDTLPQRFPTNTGTGLELKVLQHIFSPEEAKMAVQLQPMPELPGDIAKRIGKDPEETEAFTLQWSTRTSVRPAASVNPAARWTPSPWRIAPGSIWTAASVADYV